MATMRDVAQLAGVSTATVSHVVNGTKKLSPETTEKVLMAIAEANYTPNTLAKSLRCGQTYNIGIMVEDIRGLPVAEITFRTAAAEEAIRPCTSALDFPEAIMAIIVCWLLVVFDGYDLIVYGTVQSSLLAEPGWGLDAASLGTVGSMAFIGMMIGALLAGRISDALGRRKTILACAITFSILTIACAFAPNAWVFGALRLFAGIGLGGLVPSANAMVAELVPPKWRSSIATLMMSGVPIGGSLAALLGIPIIPAFGWPAMFLVAAIALFVVVPLGFKYLPETLPSEEEQRKEAETSGTTSGPTVTGFASLLRAPYLGISLMFAAATLATLFAWYGLGRAMIEGLRTDSLYWGPFRVSQLLAAVSCIAALSVLVWQHFRPHGEDALLKNRVAAEKTEDNP